MADLKKYPSIPAIPENLFGGSGENDMGFGNEPRMNVSNESMSFGSKDTLTGATRPDMGFDDGPLSNFNPIDQNGKFRNTFLSEFNALKKPGVVDPADEDAIFRPLPIGAPMQSLPIGAPMPTVRSRVPPPARTPLPARVSYDIVRVLKPMREILTAITASDDPMVRLSDLRTAGLVQDTAGPEILPMPVGDFTQPPEPTNLQASGALANVILTWDALSDGIKNKVAYAEVWRSETDNISLAVKIGTTDARIYVDAIGSGAVRYYWIRYVSKANVVGTFNAQAGTVGETAYDASYLLDVLAANPPSGATYNPLLYVQESSIEIDGITIPAGVYMTMLYVRALSVTNAQIANLAVDDAKIASLDAGKISTGYLDADRIEVGSIDAKIANIEDAQIESLDAGKITTGYLDADRLDAGTITADKLDVDELSAITANLGEITAGSIRGINVNSSSHTTKGSYLTTASTSGDTTLNVKNTDDFATSGSGWIIDSTNDRDAFNYTGKTSTTLTGCSGVLTHNNGATIVPYTKNIVIDDATNEIRLFSDRGDGTIVESASIGIHDAATDYAVAVFGTNEVGTSNTAIYAASYSSTAVYAVSYSGVGGSFHSETNAGVVGLSDSGHGVYGGSFSGDGVNGTSGTGSGIYGYSVDFIGAYGYSENDVGVYGFSEDGTAIVGETGSATGIGVEALGGETGLYAEGTVYGAQAQGGTFDFYSIGGGGYGPFTGGHDGLAFKESIFSQGDILVDAEIINHCNISNTIAINELSTTALQKGCIGVFVSEREFTGRVAALFDIVDATLIEYDSIYKSITFNAVGEGQINVCKEGGNLETGDLICASSIPGKGMKQPDDIVRGYTVAKVRENVVWDEGDDSIKMVACIYLCG